MEIAQGHQESRLGIHVILCADWGKGTEKRAVYVAHIPGRAVYRLKPSVCWSVAAILGEAKRLSSKGPVLATFDAPLGVPKTYLAAASNVPFGERPQLSSISYAAPA